MDPHTARYLWALLTPEQQQEYVERTVAIVRKIEALLTRMGGEVADAAEAIVNGADQ